MVDEKALQHLAKLAQLAVTETEAREYADQLSKALAHFQQIEGIPTEGVLPLVTASDVEIWWRADEVIKENSVEEILSNAPDRQGNLFRVPPVV